MARELNARHRKFVEVFSGNATEAARLAGYSASSDASLAQIGHKLMHDPRIIAALKAREAKEPVPGKATRLERQEFWTLVMRDEARDMRERLKASELLGKSEADFTEKLEVKGELTLEMLVLESLQKGKPSTGES